MRLAYRPSPKHIRCFNTRLHKPEKLENLSVSMDDLDRLREQGANTSAIIRLFQCIIGPRVRRQYFLGWATEGVPYVPNKLEQYADHVILAAHMICSFAFYASPFYLAYFLIRQGVPSVTGVLSALRSLAFIPVSFSLAYVARGVGRFKNKSYTDFLKAWNTARGLKTKIGPLEEELLNSFPLRRVRTLLELVAKGPNLIVAQTTGIGGFDFDMAKYPVTFRHDESTVKPRRLMSARRRGIMERIIRFPITAARFVAAHYVARRLIYPGSLAVYNLAVADGLSTGRARYKRKYDAHRARLLAVDGNRIDCMFVDRRGSPDVNAKGNKLVICCEGNAGFYELGMMEIPIGAGYSVIGWNHPGFGDSSGLPFPTNEFNAIDVVVRYSVSELGFAFEDIILLAWSIGGYAATCAAMGYPNIGAVILDATFDDLFPLVQSRVHPFLFDFSRGMVKEYYDLNIVEQLCKYQGPVLLVRRCYDEMMSMNGDITTNRANFLLIKLLQNRYPNLVSDETLPSLWRWLRAETNMERSLLVSSIGINHALCQAKLQSYMAEYGHSYPWTIGDEMVQPEKTEMLLFLAEQYMLNFEATHCVALPRDFLIVPATGNL